MNNQQKHGQARTFDLVAGLGAVPALALLDELLLEPLLPDLLLLAHLHDRALVAAEVAHPVVAHHLVGAGRGHLEVLVHGADGWEPSRDPRAARVPNSLGFGRFGRFERAHEGGNDGDAPG